MISKKAAFPALCGLAFLAAACSSNAGNTGGPPPVSPQHIGGHRGGVQSPRRQKISHIVVIIQENRSFENLFAGYPGANAPLTGCASPTPGGTSAPRLPAAVRPFTASSPSPSPSPSSSPCPSGDAVVPLQQVTFQNNHDIKHDWDSSLVDWNNGAMDGFSAWGVSHGQYIAYTYIEPSEVVPYWTMAQQYVLADEMFPTEFGGSFTGHLTLVAGTDDIKLPGRAEVNFPSVAPDDCDSPPGTKSSYVAASPYRKLHPWQGGFPCFDQFNTIAQVLDAAKISWKIYATKVLNAGFWEPFEAIKYVRYGPDWPSNISAPQTNVLTDAATGALPSVSWVTPSKADSDHPVAHSDQGPSWVASVVNAIGESKYWPNTAIIVVWDDWGGFYDGAPPPQLDYRGLGIRVPCLIISPYAKQGYVSHVQYEYGSILRFIEETYGLTPGAIGPTAQGYTDARAASLDDAFDFTQQPRKFVPIGSKYPLKHFLHERPSNEMVDYE
ncbi:MAG TPA: alkaline phosphatase family protein [Candidatus Nitrosotalea sp.]|nr:alkaline phosphatase family protein [Candidatus Nitrosotalea sp.]